MMSGSSGSGPPGDAPSGEDATAVGGKTKSKSKLGSFKSLREASRAGSFRIGGRKKSADEASIGSGDGTDGGSEGGRKGEKKGSKKKKKAEDSSGGATSSAAEDCVFGGGGDGSEGSSEGPAKKKKKKGSSLVRKLSSKYRQSKLASASGDGEAGKREATVVEETEAALALSEAAAVRLPDEEDDDLRSVGSEASAATGGGPSEVRAPSRSSASYPPAPLSSQSIPAAVMSSSTSSSSSVSTPPLQSTPSNSSPKASFPQERTPSPLAPYTSPFPTTFPLYYKPTPTLVSASIRATTPPPLQQTPSIFGIGGGGGGLSGTASRPESPPLKWGARPRGPLGASIKTREYQEVASAAAAALEAASPPSPRLFPARPLAGRIGAGGEPDAASAGGTKLARSPPRGGETKEGVSGSEAIRAVEGGGGRGGGGEVVGTRAPPAQEPAEKADGKTEAPPTAEHGTVEEKEEEEVREDVVEVEVVEGERGVEAAAVVVAETPLAPSETVASQAAAVVIESGKVEVQRVEEGPKVEPRASVERKGSLEEKGEEGGEVATSGEAGAGVGEEVVGGEGKVGVEEEVAAASEGGEKVVQGPIEAPAEGEARGASVEEEGVEGETKTQVDKEEPSVAEQGEMEESPEATATTGAAAGTATALSSGGGGAGAMVPGGGGKREHLYKILVIGELGTGKTSIIKRYVHQFFSQHYRATIGVDFALKVINWDADTIIRLQLWDIAGQERFGNMTRVYYKEAVGAFIVFDVTRSATFESVVKWKVDLDSKVQLPDGSPIPCVLLANKCDQQKEGVVNNPTRMEEYCKEKGFSGWYETSAKENINIEEAARFLVTKILKNDRLNGMEGAKDSDRFAIDGNSLGANNSGGRGSNGRQESKSCAC